MTSTSDKVQEIVKTGSLHNPEKLKKQQEYYQRLVESGIAKKQEYNLKPSGALF